MWRFGGYSEKGIRLKLDILVINFINPVALDEKKEFIHGLMGMAFTYFTWGKTTMGELGKLRIGVRIVQEDFF